jgi:hypothetical protein
LQLRPPILPETVRSLAFSALVPQTPPRLSPPPGEDSMIDFARARRTMVDTQVRTNDVTDARILDALLDVPREIFVPEQLKPIAYLDHDIPVGPAHAGRHIMQPMVFAKLLQAAAIERSDRVLDVGCATGYSAAVISLIAGSVVALESKEELLATCRKMLEGARNIELAHGDLVAGYPAGASSPSKDMGGPAARRCISRSAATSQGAWRSTRLRARSKVSRSRLPSHSDLGLRLPPCVVAGASSRGSRPVAALRPQSPFSRPWTPVSPLCASTRHSRGGTMSRWSRRG